MRAEEVTIVVLFVLGLGFGFWVLSSEMEACEVQEGVLVERIDGGLECVAPVAIDRKRPR